MVELSGCYEFGAPQEVVWEMLLDPTVLARVMPGCEKLEQTGENEFAGQLNIRVGPVQGVFQGTVQISDLRPPHSYHMLVNGRGPAGIIRGEGNLQVAPSDAGCELSYEGTAQVSGRIASVGQRLMDSSAKAIVSQSLQNLEKQVAARQQPVEEGDGETAVSPPAVALPPAPSQTEFMLGVGQEMLADLVPDPRQRQLLGGLALLLIITGLLNWFANLVARRTVKMLQEE
ncbi:MAG: carbon monoxide dehydrogenase subunit G [Anaerolineales bacterium]|nr:carbon monoxide dehydrogenase subunit G [Anaerolineales bacterium]